MKLLLDTHTLLWMVDGSAELSSRAAKLIADGSNTKHVSLATLWEIAIKVSTGKLKLGQSLEGFIADLRATSLIHFEPLEDSHIVKVSELPFHHRDPFDRLIVAQAIVGGMVIVGRDEVFDEYGIVRAW
jgi:PIN domain nuclease of toxin-antitoxin system